MKHRRRFSLLAAAAFLLLMSVGVSTLFSQPMRMSPEEQAKALQTKLSLSDSQYTQVVKIFQETQTKMQELREKYQDDRETMMKEGRAVREDADKKIEALLTDDQKKAYETYKKERMERMRNRAR